ncbi:MAG: hypothetical protein V4677_01900 [Bacteroidota bacterium]
MFGKINKWKGLLVTIMVTSFFAGKAQGQLGIYNNSISITPGYTVSNNTSITASGQIINTSTTTVSGAVQMYMAVNTSTNSSPAYVIVQTNSFVVTNLTQGSTHPFSITTTASGVNNFKIDGNGTTVVVWPIIMSDPNPYPAHDSAFTVVTILPLIGIAELEASFAKEVIIENPVKGNIKLIYDDEVYTEPEMVSSSGTALKEIFKDKIIFTDKLTKGIYYIRFYNQTYQKYLVRKIIVN